jgi:transcriptional regulator with PAS, ATPase and Fis domain
VVIANKSDEILTKNHLPSDITGHIGQPDTKETVGMTLKEYEKFVILDVLAKVDGSKTKAAEILGIRRQTLYNKLKEYGIT